MKRPRPSPDMIDRSIRFLAPKSSPEARGERRTPDGAKTESAHSAHAAPARKAIKIP
jgi:hypothetical protein